MGTREKTRLECRAEKEGRIARACATPPEANPYGPPGRQRLLRPIAEEALRKAWLRGWNQTDAELRDDGLAARGRALAQARFQADVEARRLRNRAA